MMRRSSAGSGAWWHGAVGACTEGLGSDSGDVGGGVEIEDQVAACVEEEEASPEVEAAPEEERQQQRLPPVMARASEALVMRAERRGGRLILTEVRGAELERRVVFRASRDGGRLLLRFATSFAAADVAGGDSPTAAAAADGVEETAAKAAGGEPCQVAAAGAAAMAVRVEVVGSVVGI